MKRILFLFLFIITTASSAQVSEEWRRLYSGNGVDESIASSIIVDDNGNSYFNLVYVNGSPIKFIKLDINGSKIWEKEYSFVGKLSFDHEGNIITFSLDASGTVVTKLDTAGNIIWTRHPNSSGLSEYPRVMQLDIYNNIYLTGGIMQNENWDIMTYKYTSEGVLVFARRYGGTAGVDDFGFSITIDNSGNVYVAGYANQNTSSNAESQSILLKYGPGGNILWGRLNQVGADSYDYLNTVAIDYSNNVVVTGSSQYWPHNHGDLNTIKYDSSGNFKWQKIYTVPEKYIDGILGHIDENNMLYIIGFIGKQCAIFRYTAGGNLQNIIYTKDTLTSSRLLAYEFDDNKNITIVRQSYDTSSVVNFLKFDTSGTVFKDITYYQQPVSSGINLKDNDIYLSGQYQLNAVVKKMEVSGAVNWQETYHGNTLSADVAGSLIKNSTGDVIITSTNNTEGSFSTVKYRPSGALSWEKIFNREGNEVSVCSAADVNGDIVVAGYTVLSDNNYDFITVKYDSLGNEMWFKYFSSPGTGIDRPAAVITDETGNVYVTGTQTISNGLDMVTIKYDNDGNQLWVKSYNAVASGADYAYDISRDSKNNIYVTGSVTDPSALTDGVIIKYDNAGNQLWIKTYTSSGDHNDAFRKIKTDGDDNIYVCGETYTEGASDDFILAKYDSDGDMIWEKRYNGPVAFPDHAKVMAISGDKIYVSGESFKLGNGYDILTIEYDSTGNELWTARLNGAGSSNDKPTAIASDEEGGVYVTGELRPTITDKDIVTIKYNSQGIEQWKKIYGASTANMDLAAGIVVTAPDQVYVAGTTYYANTYSDVILIKYSTTIGIHEPLQSKPLSFHLYDNYPNPFNPSTKIKFDLPNNSKVELKVFDIAGKEIAVLENKNLSAGQYEYVWDAGSFSSGIYFCKLKINSSGKEFVEAKRMVLIK